MVITTFHVFIKFISELVLDRRSIRSWLKSQLEAYLLSTLQDHAKSRTRDVLGVCGSVMRLEDFREAGQPKKSRERCMEL